MPCAMARTVCLCVSLVCASETNGFLRGGQRQNILNSTRGRALQTDQCSGSPCDWTDDPQSAVSCTPFKFMPNVQTDECMNSGADTTMLTGEIDGARGWAYFGDDQGYPNYWVIHGCDGAGIQTDCFGDMFYIEQFGPSPPFYDGSEQCNYYADYPSHESCDFVHPGTQEHYQSYMCGWWNFGDVQDKDWLLGPAGNYNWASWALESLGDQATNPYTDADVQLVATLSPWTCSQGSWNPFTESEMNCYCDNEPWNGRGDVDAGNPAEPNWNTKLVYCGLYGDTLQCSQFDMSGQLEADWPMNMCHGDDWFPNDGSHCW